MGKINNTKRLSSRTVQYFGLGTVLTSVLFFGPLTALQAVVPNSDGTVILTGTDDNFPTGTTYLGTTYTAGLHFKNAVSNPQLRYDFTNQGMIGTVADPMSSITAAEIGTFNNQGSIQFSSSMTNSALTNTAGSTITSDAGTLTVTNAITNSGTLDIGGTIESSSLSNTGIIQNAETISITGALDQTAGTIRNVGNLNVGTNLTNNGSIDNVDTIIGHDISNSSSITNSGSLTASNQLINNGTISEMNTVSATDSLINNGDMINITTISGPVTNNGGGMIRNAGTISGKLINNGSVSVTGTDPATTNIGVLVNESNGSFDVRISKNGTGLTNDQYAVGASALINGGSVNVSELDSSEGGYKLGDTWTFMTTGSLDVTEDLSVNTNVPLDSLLKFGVRSDSSNYYLEVVRAKNYADGSQTYNQLHFGQYLDDIGSSYVPDSDLEYVLRKLDALSPGEGISPAARQAMAEMDGAIYGSLSTLGTQSQTIFNQQLGDLLRPQSNCALDLCKPYRNLWGKYYGVSGTLDFDGNVAGGDYRVNGIMAGGDFLVIRAANSCIRVGGYFGYGGSEYFMDDINDHAAIDQYKGGFYFLQNSASDYLLGNIHYGYDEYTVNRQITFLNRNHASEFDGNEWSVRLEKGWNVPLDSFMLQPFAAFQYAGLDTESFTETGSGTTALTVDETKYDSYRSELGSRVIIKYIAEDARALDFNFKAVWLHEFSDKIGEADCQFSNVNSANFTGTVSPYTIRGSEAKRDWCDLGLNIDYTIVNKRLYCGYDYLINGNEQFHTGNVGFACQW
ncbi:MAG: autotransporter domain-containing protein [Planctomycetia bacterium]|nr:autotransporter domain-containing protein [Planctomycetia bacterium]